MADRSIAGTGLMCNAEPTADSYAVAKAQNLASNVIQAVDAFNRYRTPEAHGTGGARKWSFIDDDDLESPQSDMFWSWNSLRPMFVAVGVLFGKQKDEVDGA